MLYFCLNNTFYSISVRKKLVFKNFVISQIHYTFLSVRNEEATRKKMVKMNRMKEKLQIINYRRGYVNFFLYEERKKWRVGFKMIQN